MPSKKSAADRRTIPTWLKDNAKPKDILYIVKKCLRGMSATEKWQFYYDLGKLLNIEKAKLFKDVEWDKKK